MVSDCASVVVAAADYIRASKRDKSFADLWRQLQVANLGLAVRKTKVHRSRAQAEQADDIADFEANDAVDRLARARAERLLPHAW